MAEITINQEYIVKLNATIETDLSDEEIENLIPTIPEVFKEMITEEITGGVGTVEVEPVKQHGKWTNNEDDWECYKCSICRNEAYWDTDYGQQLFDFCPWCGAKMDGKEVQE